MILLCFETTTKAMFCPGSCFACVEVGVIQCLTPSKLQVTTMEYICGCIIKLIFDNNHCNQLNRRYHALKNLDFAQLRGIGIR